MILSILYNELAIENKQKKERKDNMFMKDSVIENATNELIIADLISTTSLRDLEYISKNDEEAKAKVEIMSKHIQLLYNECLKRKILSKWIIEILERPYRKE